MIVPLGEVAPAVPAAGYAVVSLGALIAFVVSWGLLHSWRQTFGRLLELLAAAGVDYDRAFVHIHLHPLRFLQNVDTSVQNHLSRATAWSERAMVHSFTAAYSWATMVVTAPFHLGEATYSALQRAFHAISHTVPHTVYQTIVRPLDAKTRATLATLRATEATTAARLSALSAHVMRLEHALPHAISQPLPALDRLLRDRSRTRQRLHDIETKLSVIGVAGLMVAALSRLKLSWLRCPALLRMGRKLGCGGFGWLESFFATTFEALVVLDLCRFALAAQQLARVLVPQLAGTLLVQNAVCLGGGASYPSAHDSPMTVTKLSLPSAHD